MRRAIALVLATRPVKRARGVHIRTVRTSTARVRLYRPYVQRTDAALLWVHGGGLVVGNPRQDDQLMSKTAAALGMTVVSAYYRLAPRHPFPAALDDLRAVWTWTKRNAPSLGVEPSRIVVGGQSAGGGLAASLVQRLHDAGERPLAQWLFCPMLDDRTAARRELDVLDHHVWNNAANRFAWRAYLGQEPGARELQPYAAPARRSDLRGLPPTWMSVGDIELFHDEIVDFAWRLYDTGVPVTLDVTAGTPHAFESWAADTAPARLLVRRAQAWLGDLVGVVPGA